MKRVIFIFLNCLLSSAAFSGNENDLQLNFRHFAGSNPLVLNTKEYANDLGQTFTVSKFKYYIGNIELTDVSGKKFSVENYFLVNEDQENSKHITLQGVPEGNYRSISFLIGVDSLHNCSGLQEGDLDPVKGMFWAWNTGYIFLKLEGHSTSSKSPAGMFEYHVGGYKKPANAIRRVTLDLTESKFESGKDLKRSVDIKADILQILKQPVSIDFSVLSSVGDFNNAELMADNYCDMFSVIMEK